MRRPITEVRSLEQEMVEVYRGAGGHWRGENIRSLLSGSGIQATIEGPPLTEFPVDVGDEAEFTVLVPAQDAEDALEIIETALEEEV